MNVLVDTHAVIWFSTNDKQLSSKSYKIIENPANRCLVSIASLWEMGIKYSLGKLQLIRDLRRTFQIIEESGFDLIPISSKHIIVNAQLQYLTEIRLTVSL